MPGTSAAFSCVDIGAQLKARGWDALQKAEAVFQSLLARAFSGDQAVDYSPEEAAVA